MSGGTRGLLRERPTTWALGKVDTVKGAAQREHHENSKGMLWLQSASGFTASQWQDAMLFYMRGTGHAWRLKG